VSVYVESVGTMALHAGPTFRRVPIHGEDQPMRRTTSILTALTLALSGLAACSGKAGPEPVVDAFLQGWTQGKLDGVALVKTDGTPAPATDVANEIKALSGNLPARIKLTRVGDPTVDGEQANVKVKVDWSLAAGVTWGYETTVRASRSEDAWRVVWSPATVHPDLAAGDVLNVRRLGAERGPILDGSGEAIVKARPVVVVGIEPRRVNDQDFLLQRLDSSLKSVGVTGVLDDMPKRLAEAEPTAFVEVVTLRRDVYDQIRSRIHDVAGTVFREETRQLGPNRAFARALLGSVGEVLKEQMDANPGRYLIGDQVGQSGLQEQYDDLLRGTPGVRVVKTRQGEDKELYATEPKAGQPLRTTLVPGVQGAADAALADVRQRAAVVAIRVSDGAILAVANGPDGGDVNLALTGSVPPGSTFKVVTALGLLDAGAVTLDAAVDCPKTFTVEGRTFTNAGNFALGVVPFRTDFARSCNTAFASLAPKLGADGLTKAAASVGVGTSWNLGTEVYTGSVPAGAAPVDAAAAAFGQGKTLVSPASLAAAAAAVARGSWQQPKLFPELPPGAPPAAEGTGPATPDATLLNDRSVSGLRTMMREVVTKGTATALRDVPGGAVYAKTGTAEFDNNPAHTHAWVIGWQRDVAFAVFVENGGSSSDTAVPIAEIFLRGLT
jgi:cell division protein FtsI/penicillin-binding protein 2